MTDAELLAEALGRVADALFDGARATREWTTARNAEWEAGADDRRLARDRDEVLYQRYAADADKSQTDASVTRLIWDALLKGDKK